MMLMQTLTPRLERSDRVISDAGRLHATSKQRGNRVIHVEVPGDEDTKRNPVVAMRRFGDSTGIPARLVHLNIMAMRAPILVVLRRGAGVYNG